MTCCGSLKKKEKKRDFWKRTLLSRSKSFKGKIRFYKNKAENRNIKSAFLVKIKKTLLS